MIKAYLAGFSTLYEGEDIEVRYCIYEDQEMIRKEIVMMEYKKPAIIGQVALMKLLKELKKFKNKEIIIFVNDGALYECIRGTSTTQNKNVLKMSSEARESMMKFDNCVLKDVGGDGEELEKWNKALQF